MINERQVFERVMRGFVPPDDSLERLLRRRDRKRRNQRIGAVTLAIILALVSFAALTRAFRTAERPADEPTPKPQGIFSEVGGWIAYGNDQGIWAVNPTPGATRTDRIQLSERPGEPVAWSSDGSKLLFIREVSDREVSDATLNPRTCSPSISPGACDLFVLNADGTETRLTKYRDEITGSISPDGSQVVYGFEGHMYTVDTEGGEPRFLLASAGWGLFNPTFSPDGAQIAYFDGGGDVDNTLRVMNADGSGVRVVIDQKFGQVKDLAWSPDGSRLAFDESRAPAGIWIVGVDGSGLTEVSQEGAAPRWLPTGRQLAFQSASGIWVINADGSGLRQVAPPVIHALRPVWSPDGSRMAYLDEDSLYLADLDGTHVRSLGTLELTPSPKPPPWVSPPKLPLVWIAPPLSASGEEQPTATVGGSGTAPFVYAIAVLGAVGVLMIAWRARRRIVAR